MLSENHRRQRSNACLLFDIFGFLLHTVAMALTHTVPFWAILFMLLAGIGLFCACLVYAVLCRRVCELTGTGITAVVLSILGMALGLTITVVYILLEIFHPIFLH